MGGTADRYLGVLKSLSWQTGYGFIQFAPCEVAAGRGDQRDVFLYKSDIVGAVAPTVGGMVSFRLHCNERGQPQAREVIAIDDDSAPRGSPPRHSSGPFPTAPGPGLPVYQGVVKSLSHKSGYGFICCPEAEAMYRRDVFIHRQQAVGLNVGSRVRFRIELNKSGMPQARDVELIPLAADSDGRPTPVRPDTYFRGVVKSNNVVKGFGFVSCNETFATYGRDVFLDSTHGDLAPGQHIRFRVSTTPAGMPQAVGVEVIQPGGAAAKGLAPPPQSAAQHQQYEQQQQQRRHRRGGHAAHGCGGVLSAGSGGAEGYAAQAAAAQRALQQLQLHGSGAVSIAAAAPGPEPSGGGGGGYAGGVHLQALQAQALLRALGQQQQQQEAGPGRDSLLSAEAYAAALAHASQQQQQQQVLHSRSVFPPQSLDELGRLTGAAQHGLPPPTEGLQRLQQLLQLQQSALSPAAGRGADPRAPGPGAPW